MKINLVARHANRYIEMAETVNDSHYQQINFHSHFSFDPLNCSRVLQITFEQ